MTDNATPLPTCVQYDADYLSREQAERMLETQLACDDVVSADDLEWLLYLAHAESEREL